MVGHVSIEKHASIGVLKLENPPLNVLNKDMWNGISEAIDMVQADSEILALVLTGAGTKAFVAGADIKEFPSYISDDNAEEMALQFHQTLQKIHNLPKPTVAALNGLTFGGGCEVALACDFRIAEVQVLLGFPEVKLGLFPGAGGTQRLPRLIGVSRAKALILTGEPISADEAYQIGLVNKVVPSGTALVSALAFAKVFTERSLASLAPAKRAIDEGIELDLESGLRLEATLFADVFRTADVREGIQAFIEKRLPTFLHR